MSSKQLNKAIFAFVAALLAGTAVPLFAQNPPVTPPQTQSGPATPAPALRVLAIIERHTHKGQVEDKPTTTEERGLGKTLRLQVDNLSDWSKKGNSPWNLILFLNERPMKGLYPISVDQERGYIDFILERNEDNKTTWNALMAMRGKDWNWGEVSRNLRASIGPEEESPYKSDARFKMVFLPRLWFLFILAATGFSFWLLLTVGRKTALLKETSQGPFSLARTQMALWTWLTLNAYLYLYILNHDPAVDIPVSMLGLLGISATTYLAAAMVDRSSPHVSRESSLGFIRDISGGKEISLHRMQMIGWTLVLALAFVVEVVRGLSIPDFNPTLLGLMGLSAGTYVGFKFPENQASQQQSTKTKAATASGG